MKFFKKLFLLLFVAIILSGIVVFLLGYNLYNTAISEISLEDKVSQVRSGANFVKYEDLPKDLVNATVAVEDHRFWNHGAVDFISIGRAITSNIKAKEAVEGGSTITQQVAKNLYFMENQDSIARKSAELIMSYYLEKNYTKEEIFELYVNTIYYGNGYYNIKDASHGYFNKEPKDLNIAEATLLAGVPNAPSIYAPTANMELCKKRQQKVIRSMVKYGYLNQKEANGIAIGANFNGN